VCSAHDPMEFFLPQDLLSPMSQHGMQSLAQDMMMQRQHEMSGGHFNTSELNAPEYSTDEFRMFQFKVERCSKRFVHDWRTCPFAHPTENARRRDPRQFKYVPVPCPEYKRGICLRGDACPYSHGVYECWLHPAKYRTQLCKEGPHCSRPVCFFAHTVKDLRQPTHVFQEELHTDLVAQNTVASSLMQKMTVCDAEEDEALNNMSKSSHSGKDTGSSDHGSTDDSGVGNNDDGSYHSFDAKQDSAFQDTTSPAVQTQVGSVPKTPQAVRVERSAAMPTTGEVSLIGIASPREEAKARSASMDMNHQNPYMGANGGGYRRRSVDSAWGVGGGSVAAGVPVNEQPLVSTQGPRMSNAVARKLGLAPSRTSSNASGVVSPPRRSFEVIGQHPPGGIRRSSVDAYLDHDFAMHRNIERCVSSSMPDRSGASLQPSLLNTMSGIEHAHAANWLEQTHDLNGNVGSLVNSMGNLGFAEQGTQFAGNVNANPMSQGFMFPINLDEFEAGEPRLNI